MTKIINLFGAPGSGKSTVASGLFYELKLKGLNVEMCNEWIKSKVFEGTPYPFMDQFYASAKQNKKIREMIGKVDYIISEAPLLMGLVYTQTEPKLFSELLVEYFKSYENINFFLERRHEYQTEGRIQNEKEADEVAKLVQQKLNEYDIPYITLQSTEALHRIMEILKSLGVMKDE